MCKENSLQGSESGQTSRCWPSPAKLNLFLYVTGRRADGYHQLQTLFQFLDYGDSLWLTPRNDGRLHLITPLAGVSNDTNLLLRASHLLQRYAASQGQPAASYGADIAIEKRLPMGAGLGGGSSNAATVLVALNQLWQCGFSLPQLRQLGLQLGADVPVFIHGHAAFAEGVGERFSDATPPEKWYLVVNPAIQIATASIFNHPELPRNSPVRCMAELLHSPFTNDCEQIVRKRFAVVDRAIRWLLEYAPARLTGTGCCVFAEFSSRSAACQVLEQAPKWLHGFVAQGMNISPLRRMIFGHPTLPGETGC